MKRLLLSIIYCVPLFAQIDPIDYLNDLRMQAGLAPFTENDRLSYSAQKHSEYLLVNHTVSHIERVDKLGFWGKLPLDRAKRSGYGSSWVSENISVGDIDFKESIDTLFSAIYHRLIFLNPIIDEIGIGNSALFYTYDMGSSDKSRRTNKLPNVVVWPPKNAKDIPPVFYEESPDPVPGVSVSGYPISAGFDRGMYPKGVKIVRFELYNVKGKRLHILANMNADNDPNHFLHKNEFVLFPERRFEWGESYYVVLQYEYEGNRRIEGWCFSTRSLQTYAKRFYRVTTEDTVLRILPGITYAVYLVPRHPNDRISGFTRSYDVDGFNGKMLDRETFIFSIEGKIGVRETIRFNNGRELVLKIANEDDAKEPDTSVCDKTVFVDHDNDRLPDVIDEDDDNDGIMDGRDAFSLDPNEWNDTDRDGIGDNADTDDDNDGINDTNELRYGLNPKSPFDARGDLDGDGYTNLTEVICGSDPTSSKSRPMFMPVMTTVGIVVFPLRQ